MNKDGYLLLVIWPKQKLISNPFLRVTSDKWELGETEYFQKMQKGDSQRMWADEEWGRLWQFCSRLAQVKLYLLPQPQT